MAEYKWENLGVSFNDLIQSYGKLQESVLEQVKKLAEKPTEVNPAQFLLIQFQMSKVTQMGETISNLVANMNSICSRAIQNFRSQ